VETKQKIAYFKIGKYSYTNESVLQQLKKNFPEYEIVVIDILSDLISRKDWKAVLHCFKEYGTDIILRRKTIYETYIRTPYIFKKVVSTIQEKLVNQDFAFTFQTQSIFDAKIPGTPHFMYTDHTHLARF